MNIKGWPGQKKKITNKTSFTDEQATPTPEFVTVQSIGSGKAALDNLPKLGYDVLAGIPDTTEAGSDDRVIVATGHSARKGDAIRFLSGVLDRVEVQVIHTDANNIVLAHELDAAIGAGVSFTILRFITQTSDSNGATQATLSGSSPDTISRFRNSAAITGADTTVDASLSAAIIEIHCTNQSGETLELKVNGVAKAYIFPGGNERMPFKAVATDSIEVASLGGNVAINDFIINLFG